MWAPDAAAMVRQRVAAMCDAVVAMSDAPVSDCHVVAPPTTAEASDVPVNVAVEASVELASDAAIESVSGARVRRDPASGVAVMGNVDDGTLAMDFYRRLINKRHNMCDLTNN